MLCLAAIGKMLVIPRAKFNNAIASMSIFLSLYIKCLCCAVTASIRVFKCDIVALLAQQWISVDQPYVFHMQHGENK
jgi:hypothetical protein